MLLDDVAADFPELTIVMAHPAVPWVITLDRWRRDFETLDIDPAVAPLLYKDNALRVLGITR